MPAIAFILNLLKIKCPFYITWIEAIWQTLFHSVSVLIGTGSVSSQPGSGFLLMLVYP